MLHKGIESLIAGRFGVHTKALLRSHWQLQSIIQNCPYPKEKAYVTLFSDIAAPFPQVDGKGDQYTHAGDIIYICINGPAHESKLQNNLFEKCTGLVATTRNLRTILKLAQLSQKE